jgi:chromosome segregation protein
VVVGDDLPEEAVALFREAPGSFVAARDALAQQLRTEGRDADASAVKALRKPTGVVWAMNQLADRDAEGVRALMDAGAELRAAQQAAASSSRGAADRMRDATVARRAVVSRLVDVASGALEELGRGAAAQLDVISAALEVASIDADAGRRLVTGTLEAVPSTPAGFGEVFGLTLVPDEAGGSGSRRVTARGADGDTGAAARGGAADTAAELKAEVARLRRDRDAAARAASKARETADRLARELEDLQQRAGKIADKHAAADAGAGEAELEAKRADRALARATDRLQKATGGG